MAKTKLSVTIENELVAQIRKKPGSMSAKIEELLRRALAADDKAESLVQNAEFVQLAQLVKVLKGQLSKLKEELADHEERLSNHEDQLSELAEWKDNVPDYPDVELSEVQELPTRVQLMCEQIAELQQQLQKN